MTFNYKKILICILLSVIILGFNFLLFSLSPFITLLIFNFALALTVYFLGFRYAVLFSFIAPLVMLFYSHDLVALVAAPVTIAANVIFALCLNLSPRVMEDSNKVLKFCTPFLGAGILKYLILHFGTLRAVPFVASLLPAPEIVALLGLGDGHLLHALALYGEVQLVSGTLGAALAMIFTAIYSKISGKKYEIS